MPKKCIEFCCFIWMVLHGHTWWYYCTKKVFWKSNIKGWKVTISLKVGWFHDDLMDFYRANFCLVRFICFLRGEECAIDLGHEKGCWCIRAKICRVQFACSWSPLRVFLEKNLFVWVWVCFVCVYDSVTRNLPSLWFMAVVAQTLHKHVPATHISFWKLCYISPRNDLVPYFTI